MEFVPKTQTSEYILIKKSCVSLVSFLSHKSNTEWIKQIKTYFFDIKLLNVQCTNP